MKVLGLKLIKKLTKLFKLVVGKKLTNLKLMDTQ